MRLNSRRRKLSETIKSSIPARYWIWHLRPSCGALITMPIGRKFIGIEIDEGYFDIACERIRKAYAQPDMFVQRPAAPKQLSMLGGVE